MQPLNSGLQTTVYGNSIGASFHATLKLGITRAGPWDEPLVQNSYLGGTCFEEVSTGIEVHKVKSLVINETWMKPIFTFTFVADLADLHEYRY
jgi:hypothetical protein